MMGMLLKSTLAFSLLAATSVHAFELSSTDIKEGAPMAKTFEFAGWGCDGDNVSPQLSWKDVPKGTKSFAITAYDPDAPTGSGFWHWVAFDIKGSVRELPRGADIAKLGGVQVRNDYGQKAFGGTCPPEHDGMHRYQFTVWALPTETLGLDNSVSPAVVGFNLHYKALGKAVLTATYTR